MAFKKIKGVLFLIFLTGGVLAACRFSSTDDIHSKSPASQSVDIGEDRVDPKMLAAVGKEIIFGTMNPRECWHEAKALSVKGTARSAICW